MEKQLKIIWLLFISTIITIILHNLFYAIFGFEEGVLLIISLILLLAWVLYTLYSLYTYFKRGKPQKLYTIGIIGVVLGVLFIIAGVNTLTLYAIPGFFILFFLLKFIK